jgi:hypothetical protein
MTVDFKFSIDQKVNTPFGAGIISMLAVDDGGVKYYVELESSGKWIKESKLS